MLVVNFAPGPAMMYCMMEAANHGFRRGVLAAFGVELGTFCYVLAVAFGLGETLMHYPKLFHAIQILGALYLLYLGIKEIFCFFQKEKNETEKIKVPRARKVTFWKGCLVNLLNPKVFLFLIAFLPQFVDPKLPYVTFKLLILGLLFNAGGWTSNVVASALTHYGLARGLKKTAENRWIRILKSAVPAAVFITLGILLLVERG